MVLDIIVRVKFYYGTWVKFYCNWANLNINWANITKYFKRESFCYDIIIGLNLYSKKYF